jgi:hypothetical protein
VDEKIEKAFGIANYMATLSGQKQILKEEYYQSLIFYHNGGTFTATRELINFVKTLIDISNSNSSVLVDTNEIPVDIDDLAKFLETALAVYQSAINAYHTAYSTLRKNRTVEGLMSL